MNTEDNNGIVYIAIDYTGQYIDEFQSSYNSLRKFYSGGVTLITNQNIVIDDLNVITVSTIEEKWHKMVLNKPRYLPLSPYRKSIFLDTDTVILDDFSELFTILDHFDFCATTSPMDYGWPESENGVILEGCLTHNTGVLGYNSSPLSLKVLSDWYEIYKERLSFNKKGNDQTPFLESILKNKARVCTLPNNYNLRTRWPSNLTRGKVKIIHDRMLSQDFIDSINHTTRVRSITKFND